jgi:hypothetical protein
MRTFLAVLLFTCIAQAKPVYLGLVKTAFPNAPLTQKCTICHMGGGLRLSPFAQDFAKLKSSKGMDQMSEVFAELGLKDSDGDGVINSLEVEKGTNPGLKD